MKTADRRSLLLLSLIVLATSLPFISRAYFVDDYYFVTMAKGIRENPGRPYDFKSDDAGLGNAAWERGQAPRMVNPPLLHYYLAAVMTLFGEETWKLRAATLLFSFITLFSMYFLGKRLVPDPFMPAVLVAVCPAFWLTSYSLLIDPMLLSFLLLSLLTFVIACEKKSLAWALGSGFLMGLTILVKYFGVLIVPVALAWIGMNPERRRWKIGYSAFLVCLGVQWLWAAWNIATYGEPHFSAALKRGFASASPILLAQKTMVVMSFVGGGLLFVAVAWGVLWKKRRGWFFGMAGLAVLLYGMFVSTRGGFSATQSLLLSIFISSAACFFISVLALSFPRKRESSLMVPRFRGDESRRKFLCLWLILGIAELALVMPWTAGRYLLSVLPAMAWLFALLIQELKWEKLWMPLIAAMALLSMCIAHGDYLQANTIVRLSERLAAQKTELESLSPPATQRWYYLSDTFDGAQPYLGPLGWQNALPGQSFKKGDLFMRAFFRRSSWWNVDDALKKFRPVLVLEMRSRNPFRTMDVPASAGFYASAWGALPWTVTGHPLERYELYQAVAE